MDKEWRERWSDHNVKQLQGLRWNMINDLKVEYNIVLSSIETNSMHVLRTCIYAMYKKDIYDGKKIDGNISHPFFSYPRRFFTFVSFYEMSTSPLVALVAMVPLKFFMINSTV